MRLGTHERQKAGKVTNAATSPILRQLRYADGSLLLELVLIFVDRPWATVRRACGK
jgi:hypothetical protein